jgi:hypothetical protein
MPSYQYYLLVLARSPESYSYLKGLTSIRMPTNLVMDSEEGGYYQVVQLDGSRASALPSYGLFWTSIAYVVWDDADPAALTLEQQLALLDWLHWGGQLILSGPDSLDGLRHSFLANDLPATNEGKRTITEADLEPLNRQWTLPVRGGPGVPLRATRSWSGVQLKLHPQAETIPGTGDLVVQRRVGRGRVVVSAFPLRQRELIGWPSFDSFFNACLLGRPPREFSIDQAGAVVVTWADQPDLRFDPRRVAGLRYFSRDTGRQRLSVKPEEPLDEAFDSAPAIQETLSPDVGSWSDFNAVAKAARETLQSAARIEVPHRQFVLWVVGAYLVILVPVNWLCFRIIGRVEWAWAAAPIIALVCTAVVIRLARLDVGFARSVTEVAIVELQPNYPRAHVTRYDALYTSLTTSYSFHSSDLGTQVQPFPTGSQPEPIRFLPGQGLTRLRYVYGSDVSLEGFVVSSNSTGLVHSEQMTDLQGPLTLLRSSQGRPRLVNQSLLALRGVVVWHKDDAGRLETASLDAFAPGQTASLAFGPPLPVGSGKPRAQERSPRPAPAGTDETSRDLALQRLFPLAEDADSLLPGETRLVAWSDQEIPGFEIEPAAPQARRTVLVMANLEHGRTQDFLPDKNTRQEAD